MFYVVHSEIDDRYAQAKYSLQEFVEYICEKIQAIYRSDRIGASVTLKDGILRFGDVPFDYEKIEDVRFHDEIHFRLISN